MSLPGPVTVTGWSNFWGSVANSYAMLYGRSSTQRNMSYPLAGIGPAAFRAIMKALNGAAAGGTAASTYARVQHSANPGGLRTIETITLINRATTTADRDLINTLVIDSIPAELPSTTYPVDLSGNGGGGKSGF